MRSIPFLGPWRNGLNIFRRIMPARWLTIYKNANLSSIQCHQECRSSNATLSSFKANGSQEFQGHHNNPKPIQCFRIFNDVQFHQFLYRARRKPLSFRRLQKLLNVDQAGRLIKSNISRSRFWRTQRDYEIVVGMTEKRRPRIRTIAEARLCRTHSYAHSRL